MESITVSDSEREAGAARAPARVRNGIRLSTPWTEATRTPGSRLSQPTQRLVYPRVFLASSPRGLQAGPSTEVTARVLGAEAGGKSATRSRQRGTTPCRRMERAYDLGVPVAECGLGPEAGGGIPGGSMMGSGEVFTGAGGLAVGIFAARFC